MVCWCADATATELRDAGAWVTTYEGERYTPLH